MSFYLAGVHRFRYPATFDVSSGFSLAFLPIWRRTADFDLHGADTENYLTLMLMTAIKK